jgi:hypothetical protein
VASLEGGEVARFVVGGPVDPATKRILIHLKASARMVALWDEPLALWLS